MRQRNVTASHLQLAHEHLPFLHVVTACPVISQVIEQIWLVEMADGAVSAGCQAHDGALHSLAATHHT